MMNFFPSDLNITIEQAYFLYETLGACFSFVKFGNKKIAIILEKED